jgi:hypothetical protein
MFQLAQVCHCITLKRVERKGYLAVAVEKKKLRGV